VTAIVAEMVPFFSDVCVIVMSAVCNPGPSCSGRVRL